MANRQPNQKSFVWELFHLIGMLISLGWEAVKMIVKFTPLAIVTIAQVKREIIDTVEEEIREHQREMKEEALDAKIRALSKRSRPGV